MIKISTIQKKISGFKPELHWKMILVLTFLLLIGASVYATYLYLYAQKQVHMDPGSQAASEEVALPTDGSATTTATTSDVKSFTSSEQMDELFAVYRNRGVVYQNIMQTLVSKKSVEATVGTTTASTSVSTTTATTTVATSSKQ
jgi:hypothetical protein